MTRGKLYDLADCDPITLTQLLDEAKKEFEQIKSLLKESDMPNMSREFQVLLCWNEWKIKWFGNEE